MSEQKQSDQHNDAGWKPDAPSGEKSVRTDDRSLDAGASGQLALGDKPQPINEPKRTLDDIVPPGRR